jgi:hypothetical protein
MAYRLDSLRIIDVESTDEAAQTHQPPHVICRTFGFPKADSPVNTNASVSHCASFSGNFPDASSGASAGARAVPGAASPACATGLLFGGDCSTRPSKRVGIFPHDEHEDWDFLKSGDIGHSTRLEATQPGLIMSTLNRGLAHVPDRRPLTEAEVPERSPHRAPLLFAQFSHSFGMQIVAAASKEIRIKANAPVRQHQMLRYMGTSHVSCSARAADHLRLMCLTPLIEGSSCRRSQAL